MTDHDRPHDHDDAHDHDHSHAHSHSHSHAQSDSDPRPDADHPLVAGLAAAVRLFKWGGVLVVLLVAVSGITIVKPDEVALRLRFGKLTGATAAEQIHPPGLLVSFPYLIDEIVRVPVKRVLEMPIDALRSKTGLAYDGVDITRSGYAITGDNNLVQPEALLKYQIVDPVKWALRSDDPDAVVRDAVVSALTRSIAEMEVDAVLTSGKRQLALTARQRAQAKLDADGPWVRLVAVEFSSLQPPTQVARFFDDVQKAITEVKTQEEMARSREAEDIPNAEADRDSVIAEAEGEHEQMISEARGEAVAFLAVLEQYRKDPTVVAERLYYEAMADLMTRVDKQNVLPGGLGKVHLFLPGQVLNLRSDG